MRLFAAAAFMALVASGNALASTAGPAARTPAPPTQEAPLAGPVRVAMRQEVLPPGGKLAEHRHEGERYLFVVSGRLKVSNLVTGEEQVVAAGKMASEQPGDWHVAEALGAEPVTLYVIDRSWPAAAGDRGSGN